MLSRSLASGTSFLTCRCGASEASRTILRRSGGSWMPMVDWNPCTAYTEQGLRGGPCYRVQACSDKLLHRDSSRTSFLNLANTVIPPISKPIPRGHTPKFLEQYSTRTRTLNRVGEWTVVWTNRFECLCQVRLRRLLLVPSIK